jgi:hypothetical protein
MEEIIHLIGHIVGICHDSSSHLDLLDISKIPIIDLIKISSYGCKK